VEWSERLPSAEERVERHFAAKETSAKELVDRSAAPESANERVGSLTGPARRAAPPKPNAPAILFFPASPSAPDLDQPATAAKSRSRNGDGVPDGRAGHDLDMALIAAVLIGAIA
jgi:hypothetical protein